MEDPDFVDSLVSTGDQFWDEMLSSAPPQMPSPPTQMLSPLLGSPSLAVLSAPAAAAAAPTAPSDPLDYAGRVQQLTRVAEYVDEQLDRVLILHRQLTIAQPAPPAVRDLHTMVGTVVAQARLELETLFRLFIMPPPVLHTLMMLRQRFCTHQRQLDIYIAELQCIELPARGASCCLAALELVGQPYTKSIKQRSKSLACDLPYTVRLLLGARITIAGVTEVVAEAVAEPDAGKKQDIGLQNNSGQLNEAREVVFNDIRYTTGSRLKTVRLLFTMQVQYEQLDGAVRGTAPLRTEPSHEAIVLTNENQFDVAEGILLNREIFSTGPECPWPRFANHLQLNYVHALRLDPAQPGRALSLEDFGFFCDHRLEHRSVIPQRLFEGFWTWYAPMLHKLRHQRALHGMWLRGFIYGWADKDHCQALLATMPVGTFLVRFSERVAGNFAVAYVSQNDDGSSAVRHYLVRPEDLVGPFKTVSDFLRSRRNFVSVVEKNLSFVLPASPVIVNVHEKDAALDEFYAKTEGSSVDGYDAELDP